MQSTVSSMRTSCPDWRQPADVCLWDVLQVLPLRASIAHHDAHHKYSNHHLNAKNYGETFWIWDAMFGTQSTLSGHAPAAQHGKGQ